jgi:transcriptional regulator GlxA family with amidase domain
MGGDLQRLVRELIHQVDAWKTPPEPLAAAGLRFLVCGALLEATGRAPNPPRPEAEAVVGAIIARMRENLCDPITCDDLTAWSGYSRARLFQLFKNVTGATPNDYLIRLRIAAARQQLSQTKDSITAIAHATGFSSSQYFSNVFRKYAGQTPSECRRERNRRSGR